MLRFDNVSYAYGHRPALTDASFQIEAGVTGLLGVNGAGKSTALRLAVGELRPAAGSIHCGLDGRSASVGYCPQTVSLPKQLRVGEFLEYLAWLRKVPKARRRPVVEEALAWADLGERRSDRIGALSGGMVRRLLIAQAVMDSPSLLLLDEPTTGLDPEQRARIRALLVDLPTSATVLLSSHIVEDIAALASSTLVLHEGRVVRRFDADEVAASGRSLEELFLSSITHAA
ncbi:MAG: ATP-binding cassette domain-containing protein [Actinomycetales bacterium]